MGTVLARRQTESGCVEGFARGLVWVGVAALLLVGGLRAAAGPTASGEVSGPPNTAGPRPVETRPMPDVEPSWVPPATGP